jgi:hypothetical protein
MKEEYETNKRARSISPASSSDSKSSLEIYYKALHTYPPEIDESNAESAERTKLVERKIQQLKKPRVKRKEDKLHNGKTSTNTLATKGNDTQKDVYTNNVHTYDFFLESLPDITPNITTHRSDRRYF